MKSNRSRAGFSLVEVLVGLTIFSMLITVASSWLIKIAHDWKMQRDYLVVSQEADAIMDVVSQDVRRAFYSNCVVSGGGTSVKLQVTTTQGAYYQKVNNMLVRTTGAWAQSEATWGNAEHLTQHVVNDNLFSIVGTGLYVTLTVRPNPSAAVTLSGNKNYTVHSLIRFRK
jgi:prepilin-type N-terminal cleavage/methylation domain-containing protein